MVWIIIASLAGLLMLTIALRIEHPGWATVFRDILRDIGIAFFVAAIVTVAYELHARSLYDRENFVSLLQSVMGKVVPPNVWKEVQSTVIERDRIRRDVNIRIRVQRQESLPEHEAVLSLEFGYYLYGLHLQDKQIEVQHTLDDTLVDDTIGLPRFERIILGNEEYNPYDSSTFTDKSNRVKLSKDGRIKIDNRKATMKVSLGSEEKPPVRIVTIRRELINLPSDYVLVMSDLTEGKITLTIDDLPDDIEPKVEFITDRADRKTTPPVGNRWVFEGIMLPGQSIDVQFKPKTPAHTKQM